MNSVPRRLLASKACLSMHISYRTQPSAYKRQRLMHSAQTLESTQMSLDLPYGLFSQTSGLIELKHIASEKRAKRGKM